MSAAVNHWRDARCAKAFWTQGELSAYDQLLEDTSEWLRPLAGQEWLDLGCGCGRLTRALWHRADGPLGRVVAVDVAEANAAALARVAEELDTDRIEFRVGDLSAGLPGFATESLDGVVSGLAIQYAEHYCPQARRWTRQAYERLLADVFRVLRPGGSFVFSVNVPRPSWLSLTWSALGGIFSSKKPLRAAKNAGRMLAYGAWLKKEATVGRFHYLPQETVRRCVEQAGFAAVESRVSYQGLAYVFRATRP